MIHPLYLGMVTENTGNTEGQTVFRVYERHVFVYTHFCLLFATMQADDLFVTDLVHQSLHQMDP